MEMEQWLEKNKIKTFLIVWSGTILVSALTGAGLLLFIMWLERG